MPASAHDRHQEFAHRARPRSVERVGEPAAGHRDDERHVVEQRRQTRIGAAYGFAAGAVARHATIVGCGSAGGRFGGAGHSGDTDHELEDILTASRDAGASSAGYVLLRLPHEVSVLFREWVTAHYPDRAKHVMS